MSVQCSDTPIARSCLKSKKVKNHDTPSFNRLLPLPRLSVISYRSWSANKFKEVATTNDKMWIDATLSVLVHTLGTIIRYCWALANL